MSADRDSRPESYLPLHPLEFQVLLTLAEEGSTHAYAIVRSIEARQPAWSRILPTNLYRRIWRLASARLIEEVDLDAGPTERRRKYFAITGLGREVAHAEATRLKCLLSEAQRAGVTVVGEGASR